MGDLILKAVVTGFVLSVMIGPVFFVLLETSIRKGIRAGLAFDTGVFTSDIIYILIAFLFYNEVSSFAEGESRELAKIIGGLLFIVYGVVTFFKKPKQVHLPTTSKTREPANWKEYRGLYLKGFLLNMANPLVIFYWFSVLSYGDVQHIDGLGMRQTLIVFISIVLMVFFSVDTLKILGAKQLRPLITKKLLEALNLLISIVFVVFGLVLMFQGFLKKM